MTLYVPPSDQPNASDVKTNTSNEAVTSGEFWKVTAQVFNDGIFYIDDEVALDAIKDEVYSHDATTDIDADIFSSVGYTSKVTYYGSGATATWGIGVRFSGGSVSYERAEASGQGHGTLYIPAGATCYVSTNTGGTNLKFRASMSPISQAPIIKEFIVPAGTNLKVAGDAHYHIAKYKNIGS
jgi:hypothetical protein